MGLLARGTRAALAALATAVLATACYDPDVPDCALTCAGGDDCGEGQVCGNDGYCAAPGVAGTCDPANAAQLTIRIERKGRVTLDDPAFTCEVESGDMVTCMTAIPRTGLIDLHAIRIDKEFERWTTPRCAGQGPTCRLILGDPTIEVGAKFR